MKTLIVALGTSLVLATSSFAMSTSDLTQRSIAQGATGDITMGSVHSIDTSNMVENNRNVVNPPDTLTVTVFETKNARPIREADRR